MSYYEEWQKREITDLSVPPHKRVGWNSFESQQIRLIILADLVTPGDSILDVGCGLGRFHQFLLDRWIPHTYHGIDLIESNIHQCETHFKDGSKFTHESIESLPTDKTYDIVVASGIFQFTPKIEVPGILEKMYALTNLVAACNFLSERGKFKDGTSCYWDPSEVLKMAPSRHFTLDHSYLAHDFTLVMYK